MQHAPPTLPEFEHLFEHAPISLWLEDYTALNSARAVTGCCG